MSGKGDDRRPSSVSSEVWEKNWNRVFGKKQKSKPNQDSGSNSKTKRLPPGTY